MVSDLRKAGVDVEAEPENEPSLLMTLFISWFPMMLLIGLWVFFMRRCKADAEERFLSVKVGPE